MIPNLPKYRTPVRFLTSHPECGKIVFDRLLAIDTRPCLIRGFARIRTQCWHIVGEEKPSHEIIRTIAFCSRCKVTGQILSQLGSVKELANPSPNKTSCNSKGTEEALSNDMPR